MIRVTETLLTDRGCPQHCFTRKIIWLLWVFPIYVRDYGQFDRRDP